jgi:hypothetical protein
MKNLIILTILFLLFNCNKNTSKENIELKDVLNEKQTNEYVPYKDDKFDFNDKALKENLNNAIYKGDTLAYNRACKQYAINGRYKEFLYYAIVMAEKNNYGNAYWDISNILSAEEDSPLFDKYKSKYGNYSILKAYELGQRGAKSSMNYVYTEKGKPIPSSSSVYCSEEASSKNGR